MNFTLISFIAYLFIACKLRQA